MSRLNEGMFTSDRPDWATPQAFFDLVDAEFGFTLDSAAEPHNAKCDRYYTETDCGLLNEWTGVVWCNPPYGRGIAEWIRKGYESAQAGATVEDHKHHWSSGSAVTPSRPCSCGTCRTGQVAAEESEREVDALTPRHHPRPHRERSIMNELITCGPAATCADPNVNRWHCMRGHDGADADVCPLTVCDQRGANR